MSGVISGLQDWAEWAEFVYDRIKVNREPMDYLLFCYLEVCFLIPISLEEGIAA